MSGEVEVRSFPAATPFVGLRAEGLLGATSPVLVLVAFRLGDLGPDSACIAKKSSSVSITANCAETESHNNVTMELQA